MANPWKDISLSDYENHMSLDSVKQLQAMNEMMKMQFGAYPISSVMVLGVAGGNGLEHVSSDKYRKVYGVDINEEYLKAVEERYADISDILECLCVNLIDEYDKLPGVEMVIANLLIEYIGYDVFKKTVKHVNPKYVSCIIQINESVETWVSDSPYLHAFDRLDEVHHYMEEDALTSEMKEIGYELIFSDSYPLPNGKKLVRLDYETRSNI